MKSEKITNVRADGVERWYDDACGTALAMQLVGERWSLLIVRELTYGPRRFSELRAGLPGISANTLTQRLASLARADILVRRMLPSPASVQVYELTPWGYSAEPAIMALGRWAAASPLHDPTLFMSGASLMMSMRTLLVPARAEGLAGRFDFRLGGERFVVRLGDGALAIARGEADDADAGFAAATAWPILAVLYGHEPIAVWEKQGLAVAGDRGLAERFATLFELPAKAPPPPSP